LKNSQKPLKTESYFGLGTSFEVKVMSDYLCKGTTAQETLTEHKIEVMNGIAFNLFTSTRRKFTFNLLKVPKSK